MVQFIEVTEDEFFKYVCPRDIVLNTDHPEYILWKYRYGSVVGKSTPGWRYPEAREVYYLTADVLGKE